MYRLRLRVNNFAGYEGTFPGTSYIKSIRKCPCPQEQAEEEDEEKDFRQNER